MNKDEIVKHQQLVESGGLPEFLDLPEKSLEELSNADIDRIQELVHYGWLPALAIGSFLGGEIVTHLPVLGLVRATGCRVVSDKAVEFYLVLNQDTHWQYGFESLEVNVDHITWASRDFQIDKEERADEGKKDD